MAATTPVSISQTALGAGTPIPINLSTFHGGVGILVTIPAGTLATYNVEVTGDKPETGFTNWNLHDILQNKSASANSNLAFPVSAVRLNLLTLSGAGPVNIAVVQMRG